MQNQSPNPHDAFFRKAMGDIRVTRNLLQHELPEQIASQLDFSSIERLDGTYVSKTLRNTYSDMLAQATDERTGILEKIETYLRYAMICREHIDESTIERSLEASNTKEELMPTLAQKWFDEGAARGKAEGIVGGQSKLLRKQIQLRFGEIPPAVEEKIARATEAELERYAENVLNAGTAKEVVEI